MKRTLFLLGLLTLFCLTPAAAHEESTEVAGFKASLIESLNDAETKVLALAEATPQDKYGWKPGEGVRSTSQVYMHVAGGNYYLSGLAGGPKPESVPAELEKIADKAQVAATVKASFAHARKTIDQATDLDAKVKAPWGEMSRRSILLVLATHAHEHLGQAIAYARSSGIVPPWSE